MPLRSPRIPHEANSAVISQRISSWAMVLPHCSLLSLVIKISLENDVRVSARVSTPSTNKFSTSRWIFGSRDSAVGIAIGCGLEDREVGVRVPVRLRIFSSPRRPERLWGPPSLISLGYRRLFSRVRSGRGVKLTPPTSAEVNKTWIYTSTPP
jgi:hypothetical protein